MFPTGQLPLNQREVSDNAGKQAIRSGREGCPGDRRIARHWIPDGGSSRRDGRQACHQRPKAELDAASAALQAKNIQVLTAVNDLGSASPSAAESLGSAVLDRYGKIDV